MRRVSARITIRRDMPADLLQRRASAFVLWRVARPTPPPTLILERVRPGAPLEETGRREIPMQLVAGFTDLWEARASDCGLLKPAKKLK